MLILNDGAENFTDSETLAFNYGSPDTAGIFQSFLIIIPAMIAVYIMTSIGSAFTNILFKAIADAYLQVSTFVAGTFFVFYGVERALNVDVTAAMRRANIWQVPVAAALGALLNNGRLLW